MRPPTARELDAIDASIREAEFRAEQIAAGVGTAVAAAAIAHALIAIAQCARVAIADRDDPEAALRECRRIAFEDAEILAGRWYAVVRDTDLLAELRDRAKDPLAPLSLRNVGGHLADSTQNATDATPNRTDREPEMP